MLKIETEIEMGQDVDCQNWEKQHIDQYWRLQCKDPRGLVICDWNHYRICPIENNSDQYKGYGGSKFKITYLDGSVVYTTNLWSQGVIPVVYRHLYKNNALKIEMMI